MVVLVDRVLAGAAVALGEGDERAVRGVEEPPSDRRPMPAAGGFLVTADMMGAGEWMVRCSSSPEHSGNGQGLVVQNQVLEKVCCKVEKSRIDAELSGVGEEFW